MSTYNSSMAADKSTYNSSMATYKSTYNLSVATYKSTYNSSMATDKSTYNSSMTTYKSTYNSSIATCKLTYNKCGLVPREGISTWPHLVGSKECILGCCLRCACSFALPGRGRPQAFVTWTDNRYYVHCIEALALYDLQLLKDWIHVSFLLNLSLQEFASTAWNSGSGRVSAEDMKDFPFVDILD